jgi:osmoprotectant transport system permease protein
MTRALASVAVLLPLYVSAAVPVWAQTPGNGRPVVVASKPFGESYLLAEMFAQVLERQGIAVARQPGLGSTEIVFQAVRAGAVDVYPEYTGTGLIAILQDTLPGEALADPRRVFAHVADAFAARYRVRWLPPLGFENTFALAVRAETAREHKLRTLTDLARESAALRAGFTPDFIQRPDGLLGLTRAYGESIRPRTVKPLLPALKYQALAEGAVDVIDGFSTDGLLARYNLIVLEDDRRFFPPYQAAALLGPEAAARADVVSALTLLSGTLGEGTMRALNRRVEVDREDVRQVAAAALESVGLGPARARVGGGSPNDPVSTGSRPTRESFGAYVWTRRGTLVQLTVRHLWLVALALAGAALVAVPIGLALERAWHVAGPALGGLGVIQTIPSIALLAFMVPLLGVGVAPALIALWLYALYPIARATYSGVRDADPAAVEAAEALGMTPRQRLMNVRLPLAAPVIMAGVRTAGVITVGATTLAAFIGAGGLGEPIVTGLALADTRMVLFGAVPAAALALVVDGVLAVVERSVRPAHLRGGFRALEGGADGQANAERHSRT